MSALTERQREALRLRSNGLTYARVGKEMGVTTERARQLVVAALHHDHDPLHPDPNCERCPYPRAQRTTSPRCAFCDSYADWWLVADDTSMRIALCEMHLAALHPNATREP